MDMYARYPTESNSNRERSNAAGFSGTAARFDMIDLRLETTFAVVVTALIAVSGIVRYAAGDEGHGLLRCIISSVLVPLMVPRASATLRRVLGGDRMPLTLGDPYTEPWNRRLPVEMRTDAPTDVLDELARKNLRLARELSALRAAYGALARDAAERTESVERLHRLAYHDALTQLPNRVLLMDRLVQALAYAERAGTGVLVLYLDLDNFKTINDTMGHSAGDRVLGEIGGRIARCMRGSDTASRVGGDEFVLVCPTSNAGDDAAHLRARLQQAIDAPIDVDGIPVTTGASIGTAMYPNDGTDAVALIDRADQAMYSAKRRCRDQGRIAKRAIMSR
jgi:diguanylate cyclase (GGDEF)-like protein